MRSSRTDSTFIGIEARPDGACLERDFSLIGREPLFSSFSLCLTTGLALFSRSSEFSPDFDI